MQRDASAGRVHSAAAPQPARQPATAAGASSPHESGALHAAHGKAKVGGAGSGTGGGSGGGVSGSASHDDNPGASGAGAGAVPVPAVGGPSAPRAVPDATLDVTPVTPAAPAQKDATPTPKSATPAATPDSAPAAKDVTPAPPVATPDSAPAVDGKATADVAGADVDGAAGADVDSNAADVHAKSSRAGVAKTRAKAQAKAARKVKARAEAAARKREADALADRRLCWGLHEEILQLVHWDGARLTKNVSAWNTAVATAQQRPRVASNGAQVMLRQMQLTIGARLGTQVPVEIRYVAEQRRRDGATAAPWQPCPQDVQSVLFDIPSKQLRIAGIGMHAVLFDGGVLRVKNGKVVVARETFTMPGIGTFQVMDDGVAPRDKGDYWEVPVKLKPLHIFDRSATFQADGGGWVELGSENVKKGIEMTLTHQKAGN